MEQVGNEHIEEPAVVDIEKFFQDKLPKSAGREELYTIYRVPKLLRQVNDKGFEPQLLSIGPFHHGKEGLKPMEEKKLQYLQSILSRNPMVELKDYVKEIKKLTVQAKLCYSESIGLEEDDLEFEKMMLLDGCFLVEMFLRIRSKNEETWPQFISQEMWLPHFANHDMLLLENQIPLFILERIFSLAVPEQEPSIKVIALGFLGVFHSDLLNEDAKEKKSYRHLLDLFHHHCLPRQEADPDENRPALTRLEEQPPPNLEVIRIEGTPVEEHSRPEVRRLEVPPPEEPLPPQVRRGSYTPFEGGRKAPRVSLTRGGVRPDQEFPPNLDVIRIEGTPVEEQSRPEVRRLEVTPLEEPLLPQVSRAVYTPSDCSSMVPAGAMNRMGVCRPHEGSSIATRDVVKPLEEPNGRTNQPGKKSELFAIPSAEELQDAGIKFKRKEKKPGGLFDIEFHKKGGVMKIPYLFVSDNLRFILINLIAYEQCCPSAGTYFTGYAWFMDDLINTGKDVRILRKSRILEHGLGCDEELAKHFNQLSRGVFIYSKATHLDEQRKEINRYCRDWWNISRAILVREYFYSPWAAVSLAGALLALALTLFSTGLSIYSTFYA